MIGESAAQSNAAKEKKNSGGSELTLPEVLRLLGAGASGAILMVLGEGEVRTKELTERVRGYTPRTVYRYASRLTEIGVIERHEEPGVPSKVVHSLTKPKGHELHDLVEAYAAASLTRLPNGEIDAHAWGSLALLADLWEAGMIEELNRGPRSPTELSRGAHGLSYHQVSRRASLFSIGGFIEELPNGGRRRRYALTERARRAMALIAGIGRWRQRHLAGAEEAGMTAAEVAVALQTALPLVTLPEHSGEAFEIDVAAERVWGRVEANGSVVCLEAAASNVDARGGGKVRGWLDALVTGSSHGIRVNDCPLIETLLPRLHKTLWTGSESGQRVAALAPGRQES